ncbi:hypothetical protein JHD50_04615 [Sulfurimonas sp. MAG313]|nr:globin domain-containing protein [Sulfurimonas sp. MAG313]MDF1880590.1 hypothetical protein [Sulfurimonas sp. MAG313]
MYSSKLALHLQDLIIASLKLFDMKLLAKEFYDALFEMAPLVKPMFKNDRNVQEEHFSTIVISALENIKHVEILRPTLLALGAKHYEYGVKENHFPIVKSALMLALQTQLKNKQSDLFEQAWSEYFDEISAVMIEGLRSKQE